MELRTLRYFLAAAREGNMTRAAEGMGCAFCLDGAFAAASCPDLKFIPLSPKKTQEVYSRGRIIESFLLRLLCLSRKSAGRQGREKGNIRQFDVKPQRLDVFFINLLYAWIKIKDKYWTFRGNGGFMQILQGYISGDVCITGSLDNRTRELITVTVLTALPQLKVHVQASLNADCTAVSLTPGTAVTIPANVKHWHGAKKDCWFSHITVEVPGTETRNEWLEAVVDEVFKALT